MRNNQHRNITLSTKVSALQKAELVKIAQSHDITLSEFILSIIDTYKHKYGKENEPSKNELKVKEENDSLKKKNIRFLKDRESADYRVGLEMKRADKAVDERDEYRYRLKEKMVENNLELNIHPNPSSNIFNLVFNSNSKTKILVTNALGEQVYLEST